MRSTITKQEYRKLKEYYCAFYSYSPPGDAAASYREDDEILLGLPRGFREDEIYPSLMLVSKEFPESGFLRFLNVFGNGYCGKSPLAQKIIADAPCAQYGYCAGVEYLLVEGFLGISGGLMIALGDQACLYGFNYYTGHIGMFR